MEQVKFVEILLGLFLNTLSHMFPPHSEVLFMFVGDLYDMAFNYFSHDFLFCSAANILSGKKVRLNFIFLNKLSTCEAKQSKNKVYH